MTIQEVRVHFRNLRNAATDHFILCVLLLVLVSCSRLNRYEELDGGVTGSSTHTHRVSEYFQVDSQGIIVYITKVFCEALVPRLGAAVIF